MFLVPNLVVRFFHRMASPPYFYRFTERLMPWLVGVFALLIAAGLYGGLYLALYLTSLYPAFLSGSPNFRPVKSLVCSTEGVYQAFVT